MNLNEYQEKAMATCMPSCENFSYMALNLVGEVGEFTGKIAKHIRKGEVFIDDCKLYFKRCLPGEVYEVLMDEAGDILWQLSGLCKVMGWSLNDVAERNLEKLRSRAERGVIDGNGDKR